MKTNLTVARRLAAQALAEEAIIHGDCHGLANAEIEERLGLHGNPLGQLLGEYHRGESAPSLLGLQRFESKVAMFVGRSTAPLEIVAFDPYWQSLYDWEWDESQQCHYRCYSRRAPHPRFVKLGEISENLTSRKLWRMDPDPEFPFSVQIASRGMPLEPRYERPYKRYNRPAPSAVNLPESFSKHGQFPVASSNKNACVGRHLSVV
jgi:hypothetical protein